MISKKNKVIFFITAIFFSIVLVVNAQEGVELGDTVSVTAEVVSIDKQARTVVVRGSEGNEVEIDVPEEARKTPPDNRVISTETFRVEMDETEGERMLKLTNLKTDDYIELNAETNEITIQGTTAVKIKAVGAVTIEGSHIVIGGRLLRPCADPI